MRRFSISLLFLKGQKWPRPLAQLPDQYMSQEDRSGLQLPSYPTVPVLPEESVAKAPAHVK